MRFQRTLTGGGELLVLLRPLWCFIAVVSFGQGIGLLPAWAAPAPTIATLSVTSGGNAVTTVAQGSVVTLTATVMTGGTPVTPGQGQLLRCDGQVLHRHPSVGHGAVDRQRYGDAEIPSGGWESQLQGGSCRAGRPWAQCFDRIVTHSDGVARDGATGHNDVPRNQRDPKHLHINGDSAGQRPEKRREWIAALDKIESMNPRAVIAGHKRPGNEDGPRIIEETRPYIRDFDRLAETTKTARELYDQVLKLHPLRMNVNALWTSALAIKA
ncbi:MAG: hypothetical protein WB869_17800 [Candidatus Acidiferrales bacterium]